MLCNFMKGIIRENALLDGDYVELYAGGAAIAWGLLFEEYVQHVHINDISVPIVAFWRSVLDHTEGLCKLIRDTRVTIKQWHHQRAVQADASNHSTLEIGFSTFFLNRTNRSGILTAGVIGGKSQNGEWKLDARFNKADLIARVERVARYRDRIRVYNNDAARFVTNILPMLPCKTLVYLDPPYYARGAGLYEDHYVHADHANIAQLISNSPSQFWIVSYDADPKIIRLYRKRRSIRYHLSYSAQCRYSGSEIMFFSDKLALPCINRPVHEN